MTMLKEISQKGFLMEIFRLSTHPRQRRLRALSENRLAALSAAQPGDTCLAVHNGAEMTITVEAVHTDRWGHLIFQTEDGRLLGENRVLGQLGTVCTVIDEEHPDATDFDPGKGGAHLDLPVAARLFGLTLEEVPAGLAAACPFCQAETLLIYRRRSLWLFRCRCGKQGDLIDFIGWLEGGNDWTPEGDFSQMVDFVLAAIHARLGV